jgi:phosphomevalonate kinase
VARITTEVHRQVQGSGSGIDVAASIWGGTIRFERGHANNIHPVEPVVIWSGKSASTGPRVEAYLAWEPRDAFVQASEQLVAQFDEDPVRVLRESGQLLNRMAAAASIDYRTPELDRIATLAEQLGGAAKPSGAGGGDCAVALFDTPESSVHFRQRCADEGFVVLDVHPASGVTEIG